MLVVTTTAIPGRRIGRHRFCDSWLLGVSASRAAVME